MRKGLALAALLAGLALLFVARGGRSHEPEQTVTPEVLQPRTDVPALALDAATGAREPGAVAPPEHAASSEADDWAEDPPTPEGPGPGQALLRVRAVALESGAALAGIELDLGPLDEEDEEHEWRCSTQSDPARGLENDSLLTRADGTAEFILEAEFGYELRGHGEHGLADWTTLELGAFRAGEERAVTLALATQWTRRVEARVFDAASEVPLVGVEVRVVGEGELDDLANARTLAREVSGSDGRVQFLLPAWESVVAVCRLPGYSLGGAVLRREERAEGDPQPLPLHRLAAVTFAVQERDGRPAADVAVNLHASPAEPIEGLWWAPEFRWSQPTDASGLATFLELPSDCELRVSLARDGRSLGEAEALERPVRLAPGEHRRIEVRLPGTGTLAGRVLDAHGAALTGLPLALTRLSSGYATSSVLAYLQETLHGAEALGSTPSTDAAATTDSEGRFTFSLPIGVYHVGAAPGGDVPALGKVVVVREDERTTVELVLARGLTITGRLFDPRGEPAADIELACNGVEEALHWSRTRTTSAEDGSFALGPLLPGRYTVSGSGGDGEHDAAFEARVVEAGTAGLELALVLGGTLAVTFENEREEEAVRVWVRAEGSGQPSGQLERLAPGRYDVLALSDEGRFALQHGFAIEPGRDHELTLTLAPGATVTLPEDAGEITSFQLSVDGLPVLYTPYKGPHTVPPGHLRVEGQAWSPRARRETVTTRERDLVPGEAWVVDFAD